MKEYTYTTSSGILLPIEIGAYRMNQEVLLDKFYDPVNRDSWCQCSPKVCGQYNKRPCCPPVFPVYGKLRKRKNLYIIITRMSTKAYLDLHPKVKEKMPLFGTWIGTHYATRNKLHKIVNEIQEKGDQGFKVGGCPGCTVKRTGKCNKILMPALEGTGISVIGLYHYLTDEEMGWIRDGVLMEKMVAVGGVLTDRDLSKAYMEKVIRNSL